MIWKHSTKEKKWRGTRGLREREMSIIIVWICTLRPDVIIEQVHTFAYRKISWPMCIILSRQKMYKDGQRRCAPGQKGCMASSILSQTWVVCWWWCARNSVWQKTCCCFFLLAAAWRQNRQSLKRSSPAVPPTSVGRCPTCLGGTLSSKDLPPSVRIVSPSPFQCTMSCTATVQRKQRLLWVRGNSRKKAAHGDRICIFTLVFSFRTQCCLSNMGLSDNILWRLGRIHRARFRCSRSWLDRRRLGLVQHCRVGRGCSGSIRLHWMAQGYTHCWPQRWRRSAPQNVVIQQKRGSLPISKPAQHYSRWDTTIHWWMGHYFQRVYQGSSSTDGTPH